MLTHRYNWWGNRGTGRYGSLHHLPTHMAIGRDSISRNNISIGTNIGLSVGTWVGLGAEPEDGRSSFFVSSLAQPRQCHVDGEDQGRENRGVPASLYL